MKKEFRDILHVQETLRGTALQEYKWIYRGWINHKHDAHMYTWGREREKLLNKKNKNLGEGIENV